MSLILRRSKKKQKKAAQQLQEAQAQQQAAFLASLHQQQYGVGLGNGMNSTFGNNKEDDFQGGSSGSDPDAELLDSLSLSTISEPSHSFHSTMLHSEHSPPSHTHTLPGHTTSSKQFMTPVTNTVPNSRDSRHSLQRGQSQPAFTAAIPTTISEVTPILSNATNHQMMPTFHQQSHPVRQKSLNSNTLSPKKTKESKKIPVAKLELIAEATSLGLGRGIDATDKTPWLNKKSFQIRRVDQNIVETNEGGVLMCYNHEVQNIVDSDELFLGSLNPPESSVTISIEDELDKSVSSARRIVGQRVVNRSINFQADYEEKYADGDTAKLSKESILVPKDPTETVHSTQSSSYTFEERICQWLLHRLAQRCNLPLHKMDENQSPVDSLAKLIYSKASQNIDNEIRVGSQELVQALRTTHYVTGLQLGAVEYRIMSDGHYHKKMALEGAFGIDRLAAVFSKQDTILSKNEAKKCSQLRQIGKIENDRVAKGTQDEVILQIQVQPITRLIKLPVLKSAFKTAIEKYMEGTPSTEGGPFVIKCTGRDLYLTVNKFNNYEVEGTDIPTEASLFYFQTTDDGGNPFEFHIAYYGEDADPNDQTTETPSICRYLEAPLNHQGRCPGPLLMKHSVKVKNTRFTLRSRLSKKSSKSHLEEWIAGEDAFYVACATKKYQHGSYLAVKNLKNTGDLIGKHFHMTCCEPTIHNHNGDNSFMLFQLCTKDSIISKQHGRETPGKLPILQPATEVETRKKNELSNGNTPLLMAV